MGAIVGPSKSHSSYVNYIPNAALGATICGGRLFCKSGTGIAWIVAPAATQVSATWNGSTSGIVGNKPCVSDWSSLNTALLNCGFNPCDWFVPNISQLLNPGYNCSSQWDTCSCPAYYWSSTEFSATTACIVNFGPGTRAFPCSKTCAGFVRAFRCVTY